MMFLETAYWHRAIGYRCPPNLESWTAHWPVIQYASRQIPAYLFCVLSMYPLHASGVIASSFLSLQSFLVVFVVESSGIANDQLISECLL